MSLVPDVSIPLPETPLAKGKRGIVSLIRWKGKSAVVKRVNPASQATGTLEKEARWLAFANEHGIGPELYAVRPDSIVMEYIEGELILDFFKTHPAADIRTVILRALAQCRTLDTLSVNKKELTNPYKHVIIRSASHPDKRGFDPVMIDFERCQKTEKPKNVTQFLQFLSSGIAKHALGGKLQFSQELTQALARKYKRTQHAGQVDELAWNALLNELTLS
jgi:predicted Ser/Thr protein kinase